MAALNAHRSLAGRLRSELYHNVCLLSLRRPLLEELSRMLTGGPQTLDKLSQALLIQLSYYLATIIDPKMAQLINWPLYDKPSERTYKTQLMSFISMYYCKNGSTEKDKWITPIQPSYFNAGGFKVIQLLFEMSQLALSRLIRSDFNPTGEKLEACIVSLYANDKSKLHFCLDKARKRFTDKSASFIAYKKKAVDISEQYKLVILELENEKDSLNKYLERCLNSSSVYELKDVNIPSVYLSEWNDATDRILAELEEQWTEKTLNLVKAGAECSHAAKSTVSRSTLPDKSAYCIEYVPGRDDITIKDLETQVSSQEKFILKNMVKNNTLSFPNLMRGYAVAVCFLFKNVYYVEPLDAMCGLVGDVRTAYGQLLDRGKWLVDGMHSLELKLKEKSSPSYLEESVADIRIPPLPDIKIRDETWQHQLSHKAFTPLHSSKVQFRIRNETNAQFRQPKSLFLAPTHSIRPSIFKSIAKLHNENLMTTFGSNTSTSSQPKDLNRTTADCSVGFTKDQVYRLLSSRKSTSKKSKPRKRPSHSKAKNGCLFKDIAENSFALTRSLSSPNLASPASKRRNMASSRMRSLYAISQEESPDGSGISGVACLQSSINPLQNSSLSERNGNFKSMPTITVSKVDTKEVFVTPATPIELSQNNLNASPLSAQEQGPFKTPAASRNVPGEKKKVNSIEKLIEKYKRIRLSQCNVDKDQSLKLSPISDTSVANKENVNEINIDTSVNGFLPDLVSPGCNLSDKTSPGRCDRPILDSPPMKPKFKCRESLGTVLGVDNTFLDQFNLME